MVYAKKLSDSIPNLKIEGVEHLVAANTGGVSVQAATVTQSGASPFAVTFASLGMADMADASYIPMVNGPNGDERADLSTRTATGFSIVGGADTEVHAIIIVGRMAGQAA